MRDTAEAVRLMESAWAIRHRYLSLTGSEQEELMSEARRKLLDAVAICRDAGELPELAQAVHLLANVEVDRDRNEAAQALWEEAVSICRKVGDEAKLAHKVRHLGDLHRRLGRLDQAAVCYDEALALYRRHPDPPDLDFANALTRMADLRGDGLPTREALSLWQEARDLFETAGVAAGVEECSERIARLKES